MTRHKKSLLHRGREKGTVLYVVAAMMLLFLASVAFVVDFGRLVHAQRELQATVDASATAGSQDLPNGTQAVADAIRVRAFRRRQAFRLGAGHDRRRQLLADRGRGIAVERDVIPPRLAAAHLGHDLDPAEARFVVARGLLAVGRAAADRPEGDGGAACA